MGLHKPELVIYGTDSTLLETLKKASATLPYISYEVGYGPEVVARAHLDALWATPFAGIELFGAAPPFPLREARVLMTPQAQLKRGMPRYGVVGVATTENDPKDPVSNLQLVISALLRAISNFNNSQESDMIRRVGILPQDLDLNRMEPALAFRIIHDIYQA